MEKRRENSLMKIIRFLIDKKLYLALIIREIVASKWLHFKIG